MSLIPPPMMKKKVSAPGTLQPYITVSLATTWLKYMYVMLMLREGSTSSMLAIDCRPAMYDNH